MPASDAPPRKLPIAPVFALLSALLAAIILLGVFGAADKSTDYSQDYLSARSLFRGGSVYAPLEEEATGRVRVNDHPPPYVVSLAPLALLPYPAAYVTLAVVNLAATVAAGLLIGKSCGWGAAGAWAVVFGLMAHPGTATGVREGNVSAILLLLIVVAWRAAERGRGLLAGACVGLAAGVKLFPGLLGLAFLVTRDWRGAFAAACVGVICWLGAEVTVGPRDVWIYVAERAPENARTFTPSAHNLSMAGVAHRTFGEPDPNTPWLERAAVRPDLVTVVLWSGRILVLGLLAFSFLRTGLATTPDRAFSLLVPAMLLLSPLTWLHAVPMAVVTVAYLAARATSRPRQLALVLCGLALALGDQWLTPWFAGRFGFVPWWGNLVLLAPAWGLLGLLALVAMWKDQPRMDTDQTRIKAEDESTPRS